MSNTATIFLRGKFSFESHRNFSSAYKSLLGNPQVGSIVINLARVDYLDSSALGMLLVLRERLQSVKKSLLLSSPSPIVKSAFEIANFNKTFEIE